MNANEREWARMKRDLGSEMEEEFNRQSGLATDFAKATTVKKATTDKLNANRRE